VGWEPLWTRPPEASSIFRSRPPGLRVSAIYQNIGKALLTAQLTALQDEGKLTILSTPSITTIDNQLALIESGKDVPFQTVEDGEVNINTRRRCSA
jgi:type IV pilus assembly protein PilQ